MKRKFLAIFVLITLLVPFITSLSFGIARPVEALTQTAAIDEFHVIHNDIAKIDVKTQMNDESITWQINYEKKSSGNFLHKLKFHFPTGTITPAEDWQTQGTWFQETHFSSQSKGKVIVTTPKDQPQLTLYIQADQQELSLSDEDEAIESTLTTNETSKEKPDITSNIFSGEDAKAKILTVSLPTTGSFENGLTAEVLTADSTENSAKESSRQMKVTSVGAKDLLISPTAFADVVVTSMAKTNGNDEWRNQTKVVSKANGSSHSGSNNNYSYYSDAINPANRYFQFMQGSGSNVVAYPLNQLKEQIKSKPAGSTLQYTDKNGNKMDEVITLNFSEVGAYLDVDNNVRPIGAKLTISNLQIGGGPTWLNSNSIYPWIEFSNNLYSGVVYCYVQGFDMDVEFFEKGNESKLITFGNEGDNSVFTFSSLNGYGNGSLNPAPAKSINRHEFAGLRNKGDGQLVKDSLLTKHSDGKYFAENPTENRFDDYLGAKNFNLAAVSFPLKGTKHEFTMGTTYGRAWNTFASSQVKKVPQKAPTKTVQPLQQYQKGDTWDNPTGAESGFAQRYWNDLDSYDRDKDLPWEFSLSYRQVGHNAEEDKLAPGVPKKEQRFVVPGTEHYYFINQETINPYTESILMPESYVIKDVLPEGVTFKGDVTLYNLDGSILNLASNAIAYEASERKLEVTIPAEVAKQIHQKGAMSQYGGKDFSLRIKVQVVTKDSANSKALMTNSASVEFIYANDIAAEKKVTNRVQTRVREATVNSELTKIDESGANLGGAEFGLFESKTDEEAKYVTKETEIDGKLQFNNILPGNYWLKETKTPAGFETMVPIYVQVNKDGTITGVGIENNKIENKLKPIEITLKKTDEKGKYLSGAKFQLRAKTGQEKYDSIENTAQSGSYTFKNCQPGIYELIEIQAPAGYEKIEGVIGILRITSSGKVTYSLGDVAISELENTLQLTLPTVVNKLKKFDLNLEKKDATTNEILDGVEFTLFDESGKEKIGEAQVTKAGKITFEGLLHPGKTYRLRETKALPGYLSLPADFIITVASDGSITVSYNDTLYHFTAIKNETGEKNNSIALTAFNKSRTSLPKTGGTGRHKLSLLALLTIGVVLTFFFYYQPKSNKGGEV